MKYIVTYTNPNNITNRVYTFETRRKAELDKFLENARKYDGSYNVLNTEKISEAKERRALSMEVKLITFPEFIVSTEGKEGIVCLGCGGDLNEWVKGVSSRLHEGEVVNTDVPSKLWSDIYTMTSTGGRIDLTFVMNPKAKFDLGKMAMWRLQFGDCSWISDFKVNYADHYETKVKL